MKNRHYQNLILFVGLMFSSQLNAQQDYLFTQSFTNLYLNNVAAAGLTQYGSVDLGSRFQFTGLNGAPTSHFLTINSAIRFKKSSSDFVLGEVEQLTQKVTPESRRSLGLKHVFGARLMRDGIGPFVTNGFSASYGVHIKATKKFNLGIALGMGMKNFSIDNDKVRLESPVDFQYATFFAQGNNQNYLNTNSGFVFYSEKLFLGWGLNQLFNNNYRTLGSESANFHQRHHVIQMTYQFGTKENYIEPQLVIRKTKNNPMNVDISARIYDQKLGYLLVGYRSRGQLLAGVGVNFMNYYRFGYSIEFATGKTRGFGSGTHELQFGIRFGHAKKAKKHLSEDDFKPLESEPIKQTEE
jgi:type IX secretion system PorP/SprF family membrane protein